MHVYSPKSTNQVCTVQAPTCYRCVSTCQHLPVKDVSAHSSVHGTQRVVQQIDVSVSIHSPCQTNASLLTSTETGAPLPHHCLISLWQYLQVLSHTIHTTLISLWQYLYVLCVIIICQPHAIQYQCITIILSGNIALPHNILV